MGRPKGSKNKPKEIKSTKLTNKLTGKALEIRNNQRKLNRINRQLKEYAAKETKLTKAQRNAKAIKEREWYRLNSLLGYQWAIFFFLLGGREAGKSYAVTEFYIKKYKQNGNPFYWLRLTDTQTSKLLSNNAEKLIDADIRRKYNLNDIKVIGDAVYEVFYRNRTIKHRDGSESVQREEIKGSRKLICRVCALSTYYSDKGSGFFDKDWLADHPQWFYHICLDEMHREAAEKRGFDVLYAFTNELENLTRSTKDRIRIIGIGNYVEEAGDILSAMNFIPEKFGRFSLVRNKKKLMEYLRECDYYRKNGLDFKELDAKYKDVDFGKRAVIDYIEPSETYLNRRKGTIGNILMPEASTFTNKVETDYSLLMKVVPRSYKPQFVIKFTKSKDTWFTLWTNGLIRRYKKEHKPVIAMRPYLDHLYNPEQMQEIYQQFNNRCFKYSDLITFQLFQKQLRELKPSAK